MSQDLLDEVKANSIYPDDLMSDISESRMARTFTWSILLHVIVIGVTSIGFISLCLRYDSWDPRIVAERKLEAEQAQAEAAAEAEVTTREKPQPKPSERSPAAVGDGETPPDNLSPIERELQETDPNLPSGSSVGFGAPDSLDE